MIEMYGNPFSNMIMPGGIMQNLQQIKSLANGDPQAAYDMLMKSNPAFAQFVQQNQGKSPEQIAQERGINLEQIKQFLK